MDLNRYYLDGPGETLIMTSDFDPSAATPNVNKIIAVVTSKNSSFTSSVTEEKVTGGRSMAPRRKFLTDREATLELEDCEMDFRYISLSQGEDIVDGAATGWAFGDDHRFTIATTVTLAATPIDNTLVITGPDGKAFVKTSATPNEGEYKIDGSELTFNEADVGKKASPVYKYNTSAKTKTVSTKTTSLPKTVYIVHRMPAYDENNILLGYQEIEVFKAQTSAQFEEAYAEKTPFAPRLSFEILDPVRADKKLLDHKFIPVE